MGLEEPYEILGIEPVSPACKASTLFPAPALTWRLQPLRIPLYSITTDISAPYFFICILLSFLSLFQNPTCPVPAHVSFWALLSTAQGAVCPSFHPFSTTAPYQLGPDSAGRGLAQPV